LILIKFVIIVGLNAQTIDPVSIKKFSDIYFKLVNESKFVDAAKLFHYPPNYSKVELENDISAVSNGLNVLYEEFGHFKAYDTTIVHIQTVHVNIGGGDIPYWSKHPYSYKVYYPVIFEKEGFGFIIFRFCNINDKLEIRDVFYALPKSKENSGSRIQEIMMRMMSIIQESQK
jgi:hypothetical protein